MDTRTWIEVGVATAFLIGLVVRVVALVVVPTNRRPSSATAWILAIFFLPLFGTLAYLLIGNPKLPAHRRERQRSINRLIIEATRDVDRRQDPRWPPWLAGVVRLNENLGALPLVEDNSARLYGDYDESLAAMTAAVAGARSYVHAEFYIITLDDASAPFFAAMEAAAARGVTVRVLFDHIGSLRQPGYRRTVKELERIGVHWHPMLPVQPLKGRYQRPDLRNHRKLLVVDGAVAFTGSQNLLDRGYHRKAGLKWQDLMVRIEGPAVMGVDALFLTDWYSETDDLLTDEIGVPPEAPGRELECQVVPSGPGFDEENNLKLFNALLYSADRRIGITSPYFVPDESLLYAVTTAAERGIEVELFVSEIGDQKIVHHAQSSYYERLLRAGVRIHRYPAPYVLHAKHLTVDDDVSVIGSSNMDMRSFSLNMEVSVMVWGAELNDQLRRVEDGYRKISTELLLDDWLARPPRKRFLDNLARLTSALQ